MINDWNKMISELDIINDGNFPKATITPHSQAWGIPEQSEINELPIKTTDEQLQSVVLLLWREYMLNDEILSAISLLENAPYRVRHTAKTEKALSITRSGIEWMNSKKSSNSVNTPMDPNSGDPLDREITNELPNKLTGQVAERFNWITNRLENGNSIIDFGCIDGTMTNRWGLLGYNVTGVDLSTNSCNIARKKANEFNTRAKYINCYFNEVPNLINNHSFDIVTCSDVYEHIVDPVNDLLIPARKCVHGNGRMLLVTPYGSWLRGNFVKWSPPWTWIEKYGSWLNSCPRGHIVAPTVWSVVNNFKKSGWWVKNCVVLIQPNGDVPEQGNICVEAVPVFTPTYPGTSVSILSSQNNTVAADLASHIAALGNEVFHYSDWKYEEVREYVNRISFEKLNNGKCYLLLTDNTIKIDVKSKYTYNVDNINKSQINRILNG